MMDWIVIGALVVVALALAAYPALVRRGRGHAGAPARPNADDDALDSEVRRVREALRTGSICRRCAQASPPGSRFCQECGRPLAAARGAASSQGAAEGTPA